MIQRGRRESRVPRPPGGRGLGYRGIAVILLTAIAIPASACGLLRKPDLGQIYREPGRGEPVHPVILIPGFLGSKLKHRETGLVAWGRLLDVLRGGRPDRFALPITELPLSANVDDLVAYDIYDDAAGARYYGDILLALERLGGYRCGDLRRPRPGENCFVFYYDWRRDLVESARALGEAIENLRGTREDPGLRVDLVAHSMGGLLARYYLLYGEEDVLDRPEIPVPARPGAAGVDRVVLIGTPNLGSLYSLKILDQGMRKVAEPVSVREVFTMPSLFEMLPPPGARPLVDPDGRTLDVDLYDPATWERFGWSVFREEGGRGRGKRSTGIDPGARRRFLSLVLDRAARFHRALARPAPPGVEFITFGSDCTPTLGRAVLWQEEDGEWDLLFQDRGSRFDARWARLRATLFRPGDGVVTRDSLLGVPEGPGGAGGAGGGDPFRYAYFLCESHGLLTRDKMFQNNLFYVLDHGPRGGNTTLTGAAAAGL